MLRLNLLFFSMKDRYDVSKALLVSLQVGGGQLGFSHFDIQASDVCVAFVFCYDVGMKQRPHCLTAGFYGSRDTSHHCLLLLYICKNVCMYRWMYYLDRNELSINLTLLLI